MARRALPALLALIALFADVSGAHGVALGFVLAAIPAAFALALECYGDALEARCGGVRPLVAAGGLVLLVLSAALRSPAVVGGVPRLAITCYSAYAPNQKVLKKFGTGERPPFVAVFHSNGDIRKVNLEPSIDGAARVNPGSRVSSYLNTQNEMYLSKDHHTAFADIYPPGENNFTEDVHVKDVRTALAANAPPGVTTHLTGLLPLEDASSGGGNGPSVLTEGLIGGGGALIILLFVFGTVPAIAMPLAIALAAILNTFTLVWGLT